MNGERYGVLMAPRLLWTLGEIKTNDYPHLTFLLSVLTGVLLATIEMLTWCCNF